MVKRSFKCIFFISIKKTHADYSIFFILFFLLLYLKHYSKTIILYTYRYLNGIFSVAYIKRIYMIGMNPGKGFGVPSGFRYLSAIFCTSAALYLFVVLLMITPSIWIRWRISWIILSLFVDPWPSRFMSKRNFSRSSISDIAAKTYT